MTSDELKNLRETMSLTQQQMADQLGVTRPTYQRMELGKNLQTGAPITIDRRTALACAALKAGLDPL